MSITRIGLGARMSKAVRHGYTIYLAGQVPDDAKEDVAGQTRQVLSKIDAILAEAGTDKSYLLSATIYLRDIATFNQMNEVWDAWVDPKNTPARLAKTVEILAMSETAILAGGCFWGMQELLRNRPGVISTRVGYTGGDVPNATYRNHGTHAEALEIVFDPSKVSYREILEFFFQIHDPTTRNRQGNDRGTSYRSGIYYTSDEQKRVAQETIADVDASGLWPGKVVTELAPAGPFWEAEPEHQDYLQTYPNGYTCHFIRPGWKLPQRAKA